MKFSFSQHYTLRKSKHVLRGVHQLYKRHKTSLSASASKELHTGMVHLQEAIAKKDRKDADAAAKKLETLAKYHIKKTSWDHVRDLLFGLIFALIIAVLVRQMWFEFYEIPTGSMRPTLKEQDRLVVSKTDFGINLPLTVDHIYFNPDLVQRSSIFIFTGENMDIRDVDTLYFYLFPGKKQYIKRLMGKPGDTLYFYGGEMYGIDVNGNDISKDLQHPSLDRIEHIPFIHLEGKALASPSTMQGIYSPVILYQMNEPMVKLSLNGAHVEGTLLQNKSAGDYANLWGIKNFATARLLTKDQVAEFSEQGPAPLEDADLYLELRHSPSLATARMMRDEYQRLRPMLGISTSVIPLKEKHLRAIFDNLYTARFVVENGFAKRYGSNQRGSSLPSLADVPDGCYEFYYGKAYEVHWQGITTELPPNHPLYRFDKERVQLLYNLGIEFDLHWSPRSKHQQLIPSRYAYFRNGDLYLLGAPILQKTDPMLTAFVEKEKTKKAPFIDAGPPMNADGTLNIPFIQQYGLKIPPKSYLALGDNHAMSADSRDFGFVPESNLRGGPDFIFWPPGSRWGAPNQPPYPWINAPRVIIWIATGLSVWGWIYFQRRRSRIPLDFE